MAVSDVMTMPDRPNDMYVQRVYFSHNLKLFTYNITQTNNIVFDWLAYVGNHKTSIESITDTHHLLSNHKQWCSFLEKKSYRPSRIFVIIVRTTLKLDRSN